MDQLSQLFINPYVVTAIAMAILLLSVSPLLRRRNGRDDETQRHAKVKRAATIQKLHDTDAFQKLEMSEDDARVVMDIVEQDQVKLEGKYKRAVRHVQAAAYERNRVTLSEDQITAVLVAYRQASKQ